MHIGNLWVFAVWLPFLLGTHAQRRLPIAIPEEEAEAIDSVVEDRPGPQDVPAPGNSLSPLHPAMFKVALPIPPVKKPIMTVRNPVTGKNIQYYEVTIKPFSKQIYPNLPKTPLVGYDGIAPGPTFIIPKDTETVVRFINEATQANSVHLHGSYSRAPWDGWAEDMTEPGQYKDYYYPNSQSARSIWYHDHAMHLTAENAYRGQAGAYIITDRAEDALGLPSGYGEFDIPLVLNSKRYDTNAALVTPAQAPGPFYGDVLEVNGQPWPLLKVQPRKYRFRFLDASLGRTFALYFALTTAVNDKIPFKVISSDSGLLEKPVEVSDMYLSMGERYDIVFDFSQFAGKTIELRNLDSANSFGTEATYDHTNKVMRFEVAKRLHRPDRSRVPAQLRTVPFPKPTNETSHVYRFHRSNNKWLINDVGFSDVENRMLANVSLNTVEVWELRNDSPAWTHPIHVHLVDFKILSRSTLEGGTSVPRPVMPYESNGLKDVVWLAKNESVKVEAHYAPWPGVYMFHCHNLIHEDDDMMAAFNVTSLDKHGYNSKSLIDPMEGKFRAKPFNSRDVTRRTGPFSNREISKAINDLANYRPYVKPRA